MNADFRLDQQDVINLVHVMTLDRVLNAHAKANAEATFQPRGRVIEELEHI